MQRFLSSECFFFLIISGFLLSRASWGLAKWSEVPGVQNIPTLGCSMEWSSSRYWGFKISQPGDSKYMYFCPGMQYGEDTGGSKYPGGGIRYGEVQDIPARGCSMEKILGVQNIPAGGYGMGKFKISPPGDATWEFQDNRTPLYIYIYITNCRQYCFGLLGLISAVLNLGRR